jgi:uncharacterized protein Yka (UPF0111/DUF47 family)
MAELNLRRWFLPETPDFVTMLGEQAAATRRGMEAFAAWAGGDLAQGDEVRRLEHEADHHKREIRSTLRKAFVTPLDPEDIFVLSGGLDDVLNGAKDTVREAEVIGMAPDAPMAETAALLLEGVTHLAEAFGRLGREGDPTEAADACVKTQRDAERVYRAAMSALLEVDDLREVMGRRELYRRLSRISAQVVVVAERIWYALVKQT